MTLSRPASTIDRRWRPRQILVTRAAAALAHGQAMMERARRLDLPVVELAGDRLDLAMPDDPRAAYALAKATLAVVVAPPSKLRLQPIAPSADWRVDLAQGCPGHCSYCYLAGSLAGPPITRAYANLDAILDALPAYIGEGTITSRNRQRAREGTTFEASCYTDPLAIEHLTGSLAGLIGWFGRQDADIQLRFTTKYSYVEPLLGLDHNGRTRIRVSINPARFARFEGGTSPVADRIFALRRMADAGYPIGLTIAPIIAAEGWQAAYGGLIAQVAAGLAGGPTGDLTVELITHRFSAGSKVTLESWYPSSTLDMGMARRSEKRSKFGAIKHVYDAATMAALRGFFEAEIARILPTARILYWT